MRRAVEAIYREGRPSTGASVHMMMKQLSPAFDLVRYKTTFKALAQDAQDAGYVSMNENPGSDFTLVAVSSPSAPIAPTPESTKREYDYSTLAASTASYRTILQERRIPLLSWRIREQFIGLIWEGFEALGSNGMSIHAMRDKLMYYTDQNNLQVSQQIVQKLLYSLNFARCFNYVEDAETGYTVPIPDDLHSPLYPVVDVEEATYKIHERYLEILAQDAAILDPAAAFELLYGGEIEDEQEKEERIAVLTDMCNRIKPLNAVGQAFLAGRQKGATVQTL